MSVDRPMKRNLLLVLLACCASIGCSKAPEPEPDVAKLEEFLASAEAAGKEGGKAERLLTSVGKVAPERVDPNLAVAAVTR